MKYGYKKSIVIMVIIITMILVLIHMCLNIKLATSTNEVRDNYVINNQSSLSNKTNGTKMERAKRTVEIIDFSTMTREDVNTWCTNNNIKANITEKYSDIVEKGSFVSQSINANTSVYEGEKITIVYSLGKEPTIGQKNALSSAKSYLSIMPFSYSGLIKQLEYEGYSKDEAKYGVDNCGADWNEQAMKSAKEYINTMSFSRSGLINQLKYEGFTNEQAEYGVKAIGY